MAKKFRYRGEVYELVQGAKIKEFRTAEAYFNKPFDKFDRLEATVIGWWVAVRRGQIAAGRTPLVTIEEIDESEFDDFEDMPDPAEQLPPAEPELPESEWPLDPKGGATLTDPPAGSDLSQRPEWAQESDSMTPATPISGISPSTSAGLPVT